MVAAAISHCRSREEPQCSRPSTAQHGQRQQQPDTKTDQQAALHVLLQTLLRMHDLHLEHQVLHTLHPDIGPQIRRRGPIRQIHDDMPLAASTFGIRHVRAQPHMLPVIHPGPGQEHPNIFQIGRLQCQHQIACRHRLHIHPQPDHRTGMPQRQHLRHRPERQLLHLPQRQVAIRIQQITATGNMVRQTVIGLQ